VRAFLGVRDCYPDAARFWIAVYERLAPRGEPVGAAADGRGAGEP
jgi:hypothetical protein